MCPANCSCSCHQPGRDRGPASEAARALGMKEGKFHNLVRRLEQYVVPEGDPFQPPGSAGRIRPIPAEMRARAYETVMKSHAARPGGMVTTKVVLPRTPEQQAWYAEATLVVPLFGGHRLPGTEWEYDLARCRAIREKGLARALEEARAGAG